MSFIEFICDSSGSAVARNGAALVVPPDDIVAMAAISWKVGEWVDDSEGKIKGGGVTPMLTPCLHIGFGNSPPKGVELPFWLKPP